MRDRRNRGRGLRQRARALGITGWVRNRMDDSVEAMLQGTADAQPCPTELPLKGAPGTSLANTPYSAITRPSGDPQECQGGAGHNSWYGAGQINALRAVTNDKGN